MKKTVSISLNWQFKKIYARGKSIANSLLVIYFMKNRKGENYYGITVSKKFGKAVARNRVKRLIRESYRLKEERISDGYDIVIVARSRAKDVSFNKVSNALEHLLSKGGLLKS